jgi:beta-lactam-binding protein with PASTA domain
LKEVVVKRTSMVLSWSLISGCAVSTSLERSVSSPGGDDGKITVPNVFDLPRNEAIAALRAAGYQGDVSDATGLCGSVIDGHVIELGHVCDQQPRAGTVQGARLPIELRVQSENPWHGSAGQITEWYLMPRVVGMPVDQARAELVRTGFVHQELANIVWVEQPGCKPLTVCETYPKAMQRHGVNDGLTLSVARDPSARAAASKTGGSR